MFQWHIYMYMHTHSVCIYKHTKSLRCSYIYPIRTNVIMKIRPCPALRKRLEVYFKVMGAWIASISTSFHNQNKPPSSKPYRKRTSDAQWSMIINSLPKACRGKSWEDGHFLTPPIGCQPRTDSRASGHPLDTQTLKSHTYRYPRIFVRNF